MMIIVFGERFYGRVEGHGGEYLTTQFAHVYYLPLFPSGARWVTRRVNDQVFGFDVKLSPRSVAAAYLRIWAPLVALGVAATTSLPGYAAAAALLALSAWSWTWRRAPRGRERRRALYNQVAFGAACDPLRRTRKDCEALRGSVEAGFAEVSRGRTPDDVARMGADSPEQAAFAYASLRIAAAITSGETARKARAASERILDDVRDADAGALADGGPYRAKEAVANDGSAALEAAAAAAVAEQTHAADEALRAASSPESRWANDPQNPSVQDEIARNKAARKGINRIGWIALIVGLPALVAGIVYWEIQKDKERDRALDELRVFTEDVCRCETAACVDELFTARMDRIERAERTAADTKSNHDEIEELANRLARCVQSVDD